MADAEKKRFEVIFEGVGQSSGKMRNDISVEWPMMKERFELATDEGPFHGGDGTAPPPLNACVPISSLDVPVGPDSHTRGSPGVLMKSATSGLELGVPQSIRL